MVCVKFEFKIDSIYFYQDPSGLIEEINFPKHQDVLAEVLEDEITDFCFCLCVVQLCTRGSF